MTQKDKYSLHSMDNIKRAKSDNHYLGELIIANEALIRFTIEKYVGQPKVLLNEYSVEMDDILQIGRIAFMKAIGGFDCDRGILFTSYVPIAIARDIRHYLRDNGKFVKMPRPAYTLFFEINRYLSNIHYNEINFEEVALYLNKPIDDVYKAWMIGSQVFELDKVIPHSNHSGRNSDNWVDILVDHDADIEGQVLDNLFLDELLDSVKYQLNELEQDVLLKKMDGCKQSEIAKDCDITQMRVSRILKKIRRVIEENTENSY